MSRYPNYIQKSFTMKNEVSKIFDDLDAYKEFCVDYGYVFNEKHLYDKKSPWGEMQKAMTSGRTVRNNWKSDASQ